MATAPPNDNEQRLRDAGVIIGDQPLDERYQAIVENMTPDEVDVLIAVRRRVEEADRELGWDPSLREPPPSAAFLMPP